jgi:transcription-repair coupling factor (superfamily II helicase)
MTATPIPRTLHMAMIGVRDISTLQTAPRERQAVTTRVVEYSDELVAEAIRAELAREGQVYLVHNRVDDIQHLARTIAMLVPEASVVVAHGQMPERTLEQAMAMFIEGRATVLVCTTIIENGLDIRGANTMLIDRADTYGLSELHQLRGRVGRYDRRAYCYLMVRPDRALSEIGSKRLKVIEELSSLGAGFDISLRDLEIRGAGNIIGREQSGHIAAIGYELYCRLLRAAADQLRDLPSGSVLPPEVPIDLGLDCGIPPEYVPEAEERLVLYTRLATVPDAAAEDELGAELLDRFGPLPPEVEALLTTARIKAVCGRLGVVSVHTDAEQVHHRLVLRTSAGRAAAVAGALATPHAFVRDVDARTVMIDLDIASDDAIILVAALRRLFLADRGEAGSGEEATLSARRRT